MVRQRLELNPDSELERLYRVQAPRLWRALYAYAGDREVTSDAVAEAFAQLMGRGDAVRDARMWVWKTAFRSPPVSCKIAADGQASRPIGLFRAGGQS